MALEELDNLVNIFNSPDFGNRNLAIQLAVILLYDKNIPIMDHITSNDFYRKRAYLKKVIKSNIWRDEFSRRVQETYDVRRRQEVKEIYKITDYEFNN